MWIVVFFPSFFARPYEVENIVIKPPRKEGGTYCTDDADVIEEKRERNGLFFVWPDLLSVTYSCCPADPSHVRSWDPFIQTSVGVSMLARCLTFHDDASAAAAGRQARPRPGLQDTCTLVLTALPNNYSGRLWPVRCSSRVRAIRGRRRRAAQVVKECTSNSTNTSGAYVLLPN